MTIKFLVYTAGWKLSVRQLKLVTSVTDHKLYGKTNSTDIHRLLKDEEFARRAVLRWYRRILYEFLIDTGGSSSETKLPETDPFYDFSFADIDKTDRWRLNPRNVRQRGGQ